VIAFLIIAALVLLNGIFVAAEFAIVGAPRSAIDARVARGDRLARLVQAVLRDPQSQDRYIATAQLGITVASLGLGMYGEHVLADGIFALLEAVPGRSAAPAWLLSHGIASVVAIAILTYFHIVIGEMVPKSLALSYAERMALWITPPMLWIKTLVFPLIVALNGTGNAVLGMLGVNRRAQNAEQYYTPEELQMIVQESEELGAIRAESGQMLQELFEFGGLTAAEAMVPRVRITGIPVGSTPDKIRQILAKSHHTRYPIIEGDLDHIAGMIHIKDLLRLLLRREAVGPRHARAVPLVPETAPLDAVLATMRRERSQMAVVIDEHGGTSGIVTLQDLFEEVIGEIAEGATGGAQLKRDDQGRLRVPGTMRIDELGQLFDLELEHEDVDRVSGLVLALLGRPPRVGDVVKYDRLILEVTALAGHGVAECAVTLTEPEQSA
jgi:CBS domain containing-hemolysin-like protein